MTREEAIKHFEEVAQCNYKPTREAAELAIAALLAQPSPAKLDRGRWKGCRLCRGQESDYWYYGVIKFNFCPNCGFPCTEEAWAELERRIGGNAND